MGVHVSIIIYVRMCVGGEGVKIIYTVILLGLENWSVSCQYGSG